MRKVSAVMILVVALVCALAFFFWGHATKATVNRSTAEDSADAAQTATGAGAAAPADAARASPKSISGSEPANAKLPEPTPTDVPAQAPVRLVVSGRVMDTAEDALVPGASVILVYDDEVLRTVTDEKGEFRFELTEGLAMPAEAMLTAAKPKVGEGSTKAKAGDGNVVLLRPKVPPTILVVRVESAAVPEKAWLNWERGEGDMLGAEFKRGDPGARIKIPREKNDGRGTCRACVQWFGQLLASEPIEIKWGEEQEVVLKPPVGATLRVRVLGHDGAMEGAEFDVRGRNIKKMMLRTDSKGVSEVSGLPAPLELTVDPEYFAQGVICTATQNVSFAAASDVREVFFDLSGCGVVVNKLTVGKEKADVLRISGEGLNNAYVFMENWETGEEYERIYGLKPGRYRVLVEQYGNGVDLEFNGEFEVVPPPTLSVWERNFEPTRFVVRTQGAAEPSRLRAWIMADWAVSSVPYEPDASGTFVLPEMGGGKYMLLVAGGGFASQVMEVDLAKQTEVTLLVERAGEVNLIERDQRENEQGFSIMVVGLDPKQPRFRSTNRKMTLAPGRYRVEAYRYDSAPSKPVEFTVVAGESTDCEIGPAYTSRLIVYATDRGSLWAYKIKIRQGEKEIEFAGSRTTHGGSGEEYFTYRFEAEGKLTVTLTRDGFETIERDFEVARGGEVKIEVTPKRKE